MLPFASTLDKMFCPLRKVVAFDPPPREVVGVVAGRWISAVVYTLHSGTISTAVSGGGGGCSVVAAVAAF